MFIPFFLMIRQHATRFAGAGVLALLSACQSIPPSPPVEAPSVAPPVVVAPLPQHRIALVLGGGAAKGFAHVGVIKKLEEAGIYPDMVVGTSAGAAVGALYAYGYSGVELEQMSRQIEESQLTDWSLPNRGVIKGQALQGFIDRAVQHQPLEKLKRPLAVVATDLHSGEMVVFRSGDTGMAVRASSTVPGLFQPLTIDRHEYVDGGLVSPVPVKVARALGADFVIAVDISKAPETGKTDSYLEVMIQSFIIMGKTIRSYELPLADVVIRPDMQGIGGLNFKRREEAIREGERAAAAILPELKQRLTHVSGASEQAGVSSIR